MVDKQSAPQRMEEPQKAGKCETCGHAYASHAPFNETEICNECARPWEGLGVGGEFHAFDGPRLAGGTYDPESERNAYDQAMKEANR